MVLSYSGDIIFKLVIDMFVILSCSSRVCVVLVVLCYVVIFFVIQCFYFCLRLLCYICA